MLFGIVGESIIDILYNANLIAGSIFCRLVSKICVKAILSNIPSHFQPTQLDLSTPGGCEAAVHSVRIPPTRQQRVVVKS